MKATLKIKLGEKILELSGEGKETDIIKYLSFWSGLPQTCGACKSPDIGLYHRAPKGNDYYGLTCNGCGAELTFHQLKTGGFFLKADDKWKRWQDNGGTKQEVTDGPFSEGF